MSNRNIIIISTVVLGAMIGYPAHADDDFNCYSSKVPERGAACQANVVQLENGVSFSCGEPRSQDQAIYCGAVYGYERNWCARIAAPGLREACFRDTE